MVKQLGPSRMTRPCPQLLQQTHRPIRAYRRFCSMATIAHGRVRILLPQQVRRLAKFPRKREIAPEIRGFCAFDFVSRIPNGNLGAQTGESLRPRREYSHFAETVAGDRVRSALPSAGRSRTAAISSPARAVMGAVRPFLPPEDRSRTYELSNKSL